MSSLPASRRDARSLWACAASFNGYRAAIVVVMTPWRAHPNTSSARQASSPGRAVKWATDGRMTESDRAASVGNSTAGGRAAGGADHDQGAAYRQALQAVLDGVSALYAVIHHIHTATFGDVGDRCSEVGVVDGVIRAVVHGDASLLCGGGGADHRRAEVVCNLRQQPSDTSGCGVHQHRGVCSDGEGVRGEVVRRDALHQQCDRVWVLMSSGMETTLVSSSTTVSAKLPSPLSHPTRRPTHSASTSDPDLNDVTGALHSRDERSRDRALALVDVEVVDAGGLNGNLKLGRPGIRGVDLGEGDLFGATVLVDDGGFHAVLRMS